MTTSAAPRTQPDVPKLVNRTDTILEVETLEGQEYRINQKEWQSSGRFEGLSPDTEYVIETRLIPGEGEEALVSDPLIVRTMKAAAEAPAKPELKSSTADTIEVTAVEDWNTRSAKARHLRISSGAGRRLPYSAD